MKFAKAPSRSCCPVLLFGWAVMPSDYISRLYDGLCAEQEPGMAHYPFDDIRQGYCTGIDSYLSVLGVIMLLAALASAVALTLRQKHMDNA